MVYVGVVNTIVSTVIEVKGWTIKGSCFDYRQGLETFPFPKKSRQNSGPNMSSTYRVPVKRQPVREADRSPDLGPRLRMGITLPVPPLTSS
jgi:hypothetical protein